MGVARADDGIVDATDIDAVGGVGVAEVVVVVGNAAEGGLSWGACCAGVVDEVAPSEERSRFANASCSMPGLKCSFS